MAAPISSAVLGSILLTDTYTTTLSSQTSSERYETIMNFREKLPLLHLSAPIIHVNQKKFLLRWHHDLLLFQGNGEVQVGMKVCRQGVVLVKDGIFLGGLGRAIKSQAIEI